MKSQDESSETISQDETDYSSWPDPISLSALAKLTGRDRRTVTELLEQSGLKPIEVYQNAHLYDLRKALPIVFEFGSFAIDGEYVSNGNEKLNPKFEKARLDKVRRLMLEQEFDLRSRKLIKREDLEPVLEKLFSVIKSKLLNLPLRAAQRTDSKQFNQIRLVVDECVRDSLNELASIRIFDEPDQGSDSDQS